MKKVLSLLLSILIIFSFTGCNTIDMQDLSETTTNKEDAIMNAKIGDTIFFGSYEQDGMNNGKEEIEWIVLDKQDNKILVISKYALEHCDDFTNQDANALMSGSWEISALRKWLNETFIDDAFTPEEQNRIVLSNIVNEDTMYYDYTSGESRVKEAGNDTQDKLFLLSITEAEKYFSSEEERQAEPTAYLKARGIHVDENGKVWWYLRSPSATYYFPPSFVANTGRIELDGAFSFDSMVRNVSCAIRPAMWITV